MAAEAAISSAVELLGNLLIEKVKFLRGVEGEVELLKDELRRMQCFLEDANRKQVEDKQVRNWISDIREVAQDTEDTIEMFLLNVENEKNRGFLKICTGFSKRLHYLDRIGDEIKSIRTRLDEIVRSRERYGIKGLEVEEHSTRSSQIELRRQLAPWEKDEHLVGIEHDVKKLLQESILNKKKKGISVAVIHGMGGIGKSTLAREIYNHPDVVTGPFDCRAWVVVSSEFTAKETIKQLILELRISDEKKRELREVEESTKDELYLLRKLKEMLHRQLQGKNYFIVLDDLWDNQHWEALKSAFPIEPDKTSRLLVTTRNKIMTKYYQDEHEMRLLDPEKSWELLLKKANIGSSNGKCPRELESIGRQIVERCHGLPLAISVVGGLLVGTQTKSGWEQVLNQIDFYLGRAKNDILPILELSYQNLSPQLKPCFLCLAFFKEDSTISVEKLVNIWVALGLIQQEESCTTDEIARGYLNELINRSMIQIQDITIDDRVENCRLHDLLREVCLRKAKDEMGVEIVKGEEGVSSESSYKPRHRVLYGKNLETFGKDHKAFSSNKNKHLCSLFHIDVFNVGAPPRYLKSFQLLKILYLDGLVFAELPDSFRCLLGLKYLRVRCRQLQLPSWLDHLKSLEVLEVDDVMFPNAALKMERLRIFVANYVIGRPMRIENWENIETLRGVRLKDLLRISSSLMVISRLRELGLDIEEGDGDDVVSRARAFLEKMTTLVELHLRFIGTEFNVEKLIPNLNSLTKLEIEMRGRWFKCPAASVFPPNISHLVLTSLTLRYDDDPMEEVGKLPKLQYLTLRYTDKKDNGIDWRMKVLHDGFPCLKALSLQTTENLRGIDIEEGGMPHLRQLQIKDCPNLQTENLPKHITISSA